MKNIYPIFSKKLVARRGLSLVEVLIGTMIIAVALYGTILALTTQRVAENQLRQSKVLRQLHYQLVREVLKGERRGDSPKVLEWNGEFTNPALGNTIIHHNFVINGAQITSRLHTEKQTSDANNAFIAMTLASSSITLAYPYDSTNIVP